MVAFLCVAMLTSLRFPFLPCSPDDNAVSGYVKSILPSLTFIVVQDAGHMSVTANTRACASDIAVLCRPCRADLSTLLLFCVRCV